MHSRAPDNHGATRRFDDRVDHIVRAALSAVNCSAALDSGDLSAAAEHLGDLRDAVAYLERCGATDRCDVSVLRSQESRLSERLVNGQFSPAAFAAGRR
jgi:hypothetical protein